MAATVEDAVAERLADDIEMETLLAQHGDAPAIFEDIHVPADVGYPFIAIVVRSATSDGSKTTIGYDWRLLIRCFGGLKQQAEVAAVALRVRQLFHHAPVDVGTLEGWLAVADMPTPVPIVGALCQEVAVRLRAMGPEFACIDEALLDEDGGSFQTEGGEQMRTECRTSADENWTSALSTEDGDTLVAESGDRIMTEV